MLGSLISAGASLVGGLFGQSNAKRQENLQREFAQNAIQWKAADAEKAGISKIFAMGAPTTSYSPVSVGGMGDAIAGAGKALGSGIDGQLGKLSTTSGKISGIQQQMANAQLTGLNLDNDIKRAELAAKAAIATQPGAGGVMDHGVTYGPNGAVLKKEIAPASPGGVKSWGVSPEIDMYQGPKGFISPEVPQALGEAQESQPLSAALWFLRNKMMPTWDKSFRTPPHPLPPDEYWRFNPFFGYERVKKKSAKVRWNETVD